MTQKDLKKTLYSVKEVSQLLDVTPNVVRTMIRSGQLEGMKTGFQWRVKRDSLKKYL
jgi:excisionase family DNA binding protein